MGTILHEFSEPALSHAIEQNLADFLPFFGWCDQGEVRDAPELLWSITNIPFPIFNSILRARLSEQRADDAIAAAVARGRDRNVPILWWTAPATIPTNLGDRLKAHGFVHEEDVPGMAMDLRLLGNEGPLPEGVEIDFIRDRQALRAWRQPFANSFEMPDFAVDALMALFERICFVESQPFYHMIARRNGEAVGVGSIFLAGGVAGVYNIGTIPAARRQGIGSHLTLALLREAARHGYRVGVLHSSAIGRSVYHKLGFREYCSLGQYLWTP